LIKFLLAKIFFRSFFINANLNFRKMQNLGFVMTITPLVRPWNLPTKEAAELLTRHLQIFNTNPYFAASISGSVIRLEEEKSKDKKLTSDAAVVKHTLMGPYAAIGDAFFWGALRPFAAVIACILAYSEYIFAPLALLLLFNPFHVWIRLKGFLEGYRRGKEGIDFVKKINLPRMTVIIRWLSLIILAGSTVFWHTCAGCLPLIVSSGLMMNITAIIIILVCFLLIKRMISQFYILYFAALFFLLISLKEF